MTSYYLARVTSEEIQERVWLFLDPYGIKRVTCAERIVRLNVMRGGKLIQEFNRGEKVAPSIFGAKV